MRVRVPPGLALALALAFTSYTHLSAPLPVGADEDIRLYWPKLRPGGIMAGHDYLTAGQVGGWGAGRRWACDDQPGHDDDDGQGGDDHGVHALISGRAPTASAVPLSPLVTPGGMPDVGSSCDTAGFSSVISCQLSHDR